MTDINDIELINENLQEDIIEAQSVNTALKIISSNENILSSEDHSNVNKATILNATADVLGCSNFEPSNEGINDVLKTIIESLKKLLTKIVDNIIKLVKSVTRFLNKDSSEIDEMIKNTNHLSNESRNTNRNMYSKNIKTYSIPDYLYPGVSDPDSLTKLRYLANKLKIIHEHIFKGINEYINKVYGELSRGDLSDMTYDPFKDYFLNATSGLYTNDIGLAEILVDLKDDLDDYTNGSKYIMGFDKKYTHVATPLFSDIGITKIIYNKRNIDIDTCAFYNYYINSHLVNLKDVKAGILNIDEEIITISEKYKKTVKLLKSAKLYYNGDEGNTKVLTKYINEITITIPRMIKSMTMCNLNIFHTYGRLLKSIYYIECKA